MVAPLWRARTQRESARKGESECGMPGQLERPHLESQGAGWRVAWSLDMRQQWRARSAAWLTRLPAVEHLACVGEGDVGSRFGPHPG